MTLSKNDIVALVVMAVWLVGGIVLACMAAATLSPEGGMFFLSIVILFLLLTTPMAGMACYPRPSLIEMYMQRSVVSYTGKQNIQQRKGGKA